MHSEGVHRIREQTWYTGKDDLITWWERSQVAGSVRVGARHGHDEVKCMWTLLRALSFPNDVFRMKEIARLLAAFSDGQLQMPFKLQRPQHPR